MSCERADTDRFTPVSQALIAGGGFGTRMGDELNPLRCKSLMEYGGQTMIGWLLDSLQEGGIDNVVVATNHHSHDAIEDILAQKEIASATTLITTQGFREIPFKVRDLVHDRFMLLCGHHPVSGPHVARLKGEALRFKNVISAYSNEAYTYDKETRIIAEGIGTDMPTFTRHNIHQDGVPPVHTYVRNPYIVGRDLAERTADDNFSHTFSYYLFEDYQNSVPLGVVEADMPPEFDYPDEYEKSKKYLDGLMPSPLPVA